MKRMLQYIIGDNARLGGEEIGTIIIIVNTRSIRQGHECFGQKIEGVKPNKIAITYIWMNISNSLKTEFLENVSYKSILILSVYKPKKNEKKI